MRYLVNAFSINMLEGETSLDFVRLNNPAGYLDMHPYQPAIGHRDTASIVEKQLNIDGHWSGDLFNRITVSPDFNAGDTLIIAQYRGPRLPEGATEMPSDAKIEWWVVYKRESSPVCPKGMVNCGI